MANPAPPPPTAPLEVSVTINAKELTDFLVTVSSHLSSHAKLINTLFDELRNTKTGIDSLKEALMANLNQLKKSVGTHDTALRIAQQQCDVCVSNTQFTTAVSSLREQLVKLDSQITRVDQQSGRRVMEAVEQHTTQQITAWYNDVAVKEEERRHARTLEQARVMVEKEVAASNDRFDKSLGKKANSDELGLSIASVRDEAQRIRRGVQEELGELKKDFETFVFANQKRMEELGGLTTPRVAALESSLRNWCELWGLSPEECERVILAATDNHAPVTELPAAQPQASAPPNSTDEVVGDAQQPESSIRTEQNPLTNNVPKDEAAVPPEADVGPDPKVAFLIQSPVFSYLRNCISHDLHVRASTVATGYGLDIEQELAAIRNELKQRTTTTRVVELITQHADAETPSRVSELQRKVEGLDATKVSLAHFTESLRSKADSFALEGKADRTLMSEQWENAKQQINTLRQTVDTLVAERGEFQEVLRDVLYMHKRSQVLQEQPQQQTHAHGAVSNLASSGAEKGAVVLPQIKPLQPTDAPRQGAVSAPVDPRTIPVTMFHPPHKPAVEATVDNPSANRKDTPASRGAASSIRPQTELRAEQRKVELGGVVTSSGGAAVVHPVGTNSDPHRIVPNSVVPTPIPPSKLTPEDVIPLTPNQAAYARAVGQSVVSQIMQSGHNASTLPSTQWCH